MTARIKNAALWASALATAVLIAGGSLYLDQPRHAVAASAAGAAPAIPVTTATVKPRQVAVWKEFSGRLEAVGRVQIRPRVAGVIQSVHFREGGLVKKGDLLVSIDAEPYKAAVDQARGEVASAQAKLDLARTELERGTTLLSRNTISASDLAQRQSNNAAAVAALQSAEATLRLAELNLGYTEIRAPIAGRLGRLEVTPGNLVAEGSTAQALTTLVSVDPIYASFTIDEAYLQQIISVLPAGDIQASLDKIPVQVTTQETAAPLSGRLQLINNEIDASTGTIRVRAVFDNPDGRLIPGQFVRIRMGQPSAEERLVISERAVGTDQDKKFVFVVDAKNAVAYRQIELGAEVDGQRIVEKGLNAGDRIVVSGLQRIRPGAVVQPQEETALNN
ncbi:efflux RND transporter periplasmic adaptor subunit [Rhizobium straminoryzae]|uniref:Efflux RND transporter periplasmic adaptor subunit n=1 Tax=Rhizobium straminoryzae TaxID=1387186 RepID=A0A549SZD5_9HYPH|nr:efflux RND transporter periplasmic adaptor subunit [Rhizobium straminoryzae]TRL34908.1 efflux RND transporter periplasmic adaptor subunit [Rhizobium straminoryzae]